jgi:DNA polymerase-1
MLIFDIESDGLLDTVSVIHCGVTYNTETKEYKRYTNEEISLLINDLQEADALGGHNIISYDIPVIEKLYGINLGDKELYDTLIVSRIAYYNLIAIDSNSRRVPPRLKGSHGLKAWGYRLGDNKGTYGEQEDAWSTYSTEMLDYCEQDVVLNVKLYNKLLTKGVPWSAISIEQDFALIISRQTRYGWQFDVEKAQSLHIELLDEKTSIEDELAKVFTPLKDWIPMNVVPMYTKTGSVSKIYEKQVARGAHMDSNGRWGRFDEIFFNPGSRHHIRRWMEEVYNWHSPEKTEKGTPIINEAVLKNAKFPEAQLLRKYFLIQKVLGMVAEGANGWLRLVQDDGRIYGQVNTLGAVTGRCTHSKPNVAQTPSGRSFKGKECRELWTVPKGKEIVGCDASGLELRMLAHYMAAFDGGEYGEQVVNGDIHTINQEAAGLPTRDNAKTFIYGFLYGAGNAKIGEIVNGTAGHGKKLKESFLNKLPALKKLTTAVKKSSKKGFLVGLSGRKYAIRSEHSALNVLLQGAGALVMKYYLVELDKRLQAKYTSGIDYEFIGNIHDEVQMEVSTDLVADVSKIAEESFAGVEERLKFRVKLEGEAQHGRTWNDTH